MTGPGITDDWIGPDLRAALDVAGGGNAIVACHDLLPAEPGAYLLIRRIEMPARMTIRGRVADLRAGTYLYAGSAHGPGGIAARLGRHLRGAPRQHWHIDALNQFAGPRAGIAVPGGNECELVARLVAAGAEYPLPGFGASDCRRCAAHLVRWPDRGDHVNRFLKNSRASPSG